MYSAPANQAEPLSGDGQNQGFGRVYTILKEVNKLKYLGNFHENELTDDALDCLSTEKDMRDILNDIKISVGVSIHFSKKWFDYKGLANSVNVLTGSKPKEHLVEDTLGILSTDVNANVEIFCKSDESVLHDVHGGSTVERHPILLKERKQRHFQSKFVKTENSTHILEDTDQAVNSNQPKIGLTDRPEKISLKQKGKSPAPEKNPDDTIKTTDISKDVTKPSCSRKVFGKEVGNLQYTKGNIFMVEENREIEFKALTNLNETPQKLPWKIMEKARIFICGILNAGGEGTIYFGIGDSYDTTNNFIRGEIIGLEVEELRDEINKAFQSALGDHIESNDGKMKKGGDMNCVNIYFVPVKESGEQTGRYVVEIEIKRDWKFCKDNVYYFRPWTEKRGTTLNELYKVNKDKWEDPTIRTCGQSVTIKNIEIDKEIKEPLSEKYKEWRLQEQWNEFAVDGEEDNSQEGPEELYKRMCLEQFGVYYPPYATADNSSSSYPDDGEDDYDADLESFEQTTQGNN